MFIRKLLFATLFGALLVMGATLSTTTRPATAAGPCDFGTATYNAQQCAAVFGTVSVCQLGSSTYNATLCAQVTGSLGTTSTTGCPAGVSQQICFLTGLGSSQSCQLGTASYNATLCAQTGGQSTDANCQLGTASFN